MEIGYRVTTPREFFDIQNRKSDQNSLLGQLGFTLKNSLQTFWNHLKTIDVKNPFPPKKSNLHQQPNQSFPKLLNDPLSTDNKKAQEQQQKSPLLNKRAPLLKIEDKSFSGSKKQKLLQKKDRKKVISFDVFAEEEQRRLNESYIRKNIQSKKGLNKSFLSQQNNHQKSLNLQNGHTITQQKMERQKETQQLLGLPKNHFCHHANLNQNDSILNISDIDSECDFNIVNNSNIYEEESETNQKQPLEENIKSGQFDRLIQGEAQVIVAKLQLTEYPFIAMGRKIHTRNGKQTYSSANIKSPFPNRQPQIQIALFDDCLNFKDPNNFGISHRQSLTNSNKRNYSQPHQPQKIIRKKIKQTFDSDLFEPTENPKTSQRHSSFDILLETRYEKCLEDVLANIQKADQSQKNKPASLMADYQNFLAKNFGAMKFIKKIIQAQSTKLKTLKNKQLSQDTQPQRQKFSQILKPLEIKPLIQRRKLYSFTRQCESKINICQELKKSVQEDKEKQLADEMRKKKQEEQTKRREEEERSTKQLQQKRRLQAEQAIRRKKEEEVLRVGQNSKAKENNQVSSTQQPRLNQSNKEVVVDANLWQEQKSQGELVKKSAEDTKAEEPGSKEQKEPVKTYSLFRPSSGSLFGAFNGIQQNTQIQQQPKQKEAPEQVAEENAIKKTESTVQLKETPTEPEKNISQVSKSPSPLLSAPVQLQKQQTSQEQKKQTKFNPFLDEAPKPQMTKLQQIINSKKDDNNIFKTIISTSIPLNSPQHQPPPLPNSSSFLSPVHKHNTSHYSQLDSSMCEQSESNITPANSQTLTNLGGPHNQNLNGSFLNNSFSSQQQTSSLFPSQNNSNNLFSSNIGISLFGSAYNTTNQIGMFANSTAQQKTTISGGLFSNNQPSVLGLNTGIKSTTEALNKVPSFMQGYSSIAPNINSQIAVNLFSQRSPTKGQNTFLFATSPPPLDNKRSISRREKKPKEQRIS